MMTQCRKCGHVVTSWSGWCEVCDGQRLGHSRGAAGAPAQAPEKTLRDLLAIELIERRLAANPSVFVPALAREAYQVADAMMEARKQ